ncbi:beta-lactamase family protein [Membranicola marinus]|uniref:Beta-lactamase family protein n=1 Tax=Membranihabitans marinus TaxID=1227546 RepID=A0A953LBG6_9BACT|nr:serine hydrolase [Membranihabitans marinus]MBY5959743.1 beta-lactamase family protein [Membranihabitans marinus]
MIIVGISLVVTILLLFVLHYFFPYFFKAFRLTILRGHRTATIYDLPDFKSRTIFGGVALPWPTEPRKEMGQLSSDFAKKLANMKTSAFLVAQNGVMVHESYYDDHSKDTLSNSFSIAKTIVALLAGKAIEDGYLAGLDQRVSTFFPQYNYPQADHLTIRDLIRMSSGMDWKENYYLPLNETTDAYYGDRLSELILSRKILQQPGKEFNYQSGNTQLLGMILDQVLPMSLSDYLSERFWKPLGMEQDAHWTIDEASDIEKTYCCIHATARDFMKFGQLFLQEGNWAGENLISSDFLKEMRTVGFAASPQYGAGLWLDDSYSTPFYLMRGHLGQYVIVIPSKDLVICRIGQKYRKDDNPPRLQLEDIYMYVDGALAMVD